MKRGLNFYEALFLALLVIKGTETRFFGGVPSWLEVFAPLVLWAVFAALGVLASIYNLEERVRFLFWKRMVTKKAKDAGAKASKNMNEFLKSNPGQFYDK